MIDITGSRHRYPIAGISDRSTAYLSALCLSRLEEKTSWIVGGVGRFEKARALLGLRKSLSQISENSPAN